MRKRWNTFVETRDRSLTLLSVESGKSAEFHVERSHNGSEVPPEVGGRVSDEMMIFKDGAVLLG